MTDTLDRNLQTVGKRTFVNCFERCETNQANLRPEDVAQLDSAPNVGQRSLATKASTINRIFRKGRQYDALRICRDAGGVKQAARDKAAKLLRKHCNTA